MTYCLDAGRQEGQTRRREGGQTMTALQTERDVTTEQTHEQTHENASISTELDDFPALTGRYQRELLAHCYG